MKTAFSYLVMFVLDNLAFPIIFIGSWLLFAEHAILLFVINLFKRKTPHIVTVSLVIILQALYCIKVCGYSSYVDLICASFTVLPLWIGYLLSHLKKIFPYIIFSCASLVAFPLWIFWLARLGKY